MTDETDDHFSDWHKDEDGNIIAIPYAGHVTALFAETGCVLFLQFWRSAEAIGTTPEHLQLGMSSDQARRLAKDLLRMADKAEKGPTSVDPRH